MFKKKPQTFHNSKRTYNRYTNNDIIVSEIFISQYIRKNK